MNKKKILVQIESFHPNYVKYIEKSTSVETYSSSFFAHNETDVFQGYCLKAKGRVESQS